MNAKLVVIRDEGNGAMMCARMWFEGSKLSVSVNGRAMGSLLETVMMFTDYFSKIERVLEFKKLELFLSEEDMHLERRPFQTTYFGKKQPVKIAKGGKTNG